jgi:hypothetical protein
MLRWVGSCVATLCLVTVAFAEAPPHRFSGDGLTIVVKALDENSGKVSGDLIKGEQTFPFTGQLAEEGGSEVVNGTFVASGETFKFRSRIEAETGVIHFSTGAKTYTLKPEPPPAPVSNPLEDDTGKKASNPNPLEETVPAPAVDNPLNDAAPTAGRPSDDATDAGPLELQTVKFNDINMGGLPAYTMLIPTDWKATGHIEWGPADNPFPQSRVKVEGPDGSSIAFIPSMTFHYTVMNPVAGMPAIPPQGVPAPEKPGDYVVSVLKNNNQIRNPRLISDERDLKAEQRQAEQARAMGMANPDIRSTIHIITVAYEKNGTPMREQIITSYARFPDTVNQNLRSQMWSLFPLVVVAAPESRFESSRDLLYKLADTYRPIPNWWTQQFEARQRIQNQRHIDGMAEIKRRAEFYNSISEAQQKTFESNMAARDKETKDFVDTIYERQEYKDLDGRNVTLSIHAKHVYSNGEGKYILSNRPLDTTGGFQELSPR